MKFIHMSDLHIGLKLLNRDLLEDQEYILHQITEICAAQKPEAIVIAGDIYDKAIPSAEAVSVFDGFISELTGKLPEAVIMIISGNHDSAPRVNCFRSVLSRQNVHMIGLPPQEEGDRIEKVTVSDGFGPVHFYLLPFVKPSMVRRIVGTDEEGSSLSYNDALHRLLEREEIDPAERNVLVSHQFYLPAGKKASEIERADSEIRTIGNIDEVASDVLAPFDYAALGHIHKSMKVGSDFYRFCGTPLACSVSEAEQKKEILLVELLNKGERSVEPIPLEPMRRIRIIRGTLSEILEQSSSDYISAVLTDREDLDILDMQDRMRDAFPNLLEIRREGISTADYETAGSVEREMDPFELCCAFLNEVTDEEKELLMDVINSVKGA